MIEKPKRYSVLKPDNNIASKKKKPQHLFLYEVIANLKKVVLIYHAWIK